MSTGFTPSGGSPVNAAISIRQPWAWLIIHAGKDIENRTWPTRFRGRVLIHASKGMTEQEYRDACNFMATDSRLAAALKSLPQMHELQRGGIIGEAEVVGCVNDSESPWFVGEWGHMLRNPKPLEFRPCRGALGYFNPANDGTHAPRT
jgi:hypothetical protein